jgi:hypothetical protein
MKIWLYAFVFLFLGARSVWASDSAVLTEMLTPLTEKYLYPLSLDKVVTTGLQALSDLDSQLTVSKGRNNFYLYVNRQVKKVIPLPENTSDVAQWADTAAKVIEAAAKVSEQVSFRDFEVPDLMMKKIAASLDEYSHYFSEYDYDEERESNAIYTLYSERNIDGFLYLRVRVFNRQTTKQIKASLEKSPLVSGVILDLRGNSGGIFNEALKTADLFTDGEIITYTAGKDNADIHYYTSKEGELYSGALVVLVDGDTASAAEVLAAGLQEQSRAKLVGTQTFGKGTIQNVMVMSGGGKLVLTTEQFFTPSGKIIHKNGVTPDICLTPDDDGNCLKESRLRIEEDIETAVKILKNEI